MSLLNVYLIDIKVLLSTCNKITYFRTRMSHLFETITKLFKNKSTNIRLLVGMVIALFYYLAKHNRWITDVFYIRINIGVISIVLYLVFTDYLEKIKKVPANTSNARISSKKILSSRYSKFLTFSILIILIPGYLLFSGFKVVLLAKNSEEKTCEENLKKTGLLIANFSENRNNDDGFTSTLFGRLRSDLQSSDTLNIRELKNYISESNEGYVDSIKQIFQENCSLSGLIVFGNRKDDTYFNCRIYSLDYLDFQAKKRIKTKDTIIYIENPDIIKSPNFLGFTIEYQAKVISDFIHGLLYNHSGKFALSSKFIQRALAKNNNPENTQFISICYLYMGNNSFKDGQFSESIKEYQAGISIDPSNEYLHYNIAAAYRQLGQIASAFEEFSIASSINSKFANPIPKLDQYTRTANHQNKIKIPVKKDTSVNLDSNNIAKKNAPVIQADWDEHCTIILKNQKYGVVNNKGDTIVFCKYDEIENYPYKFADCFIIRQKNRFGAVIHVHYKDGYSTQLIPIGYRTYEIKSVVEYCVDEHYSGKESN